MTSTNMNALLVETASSPTNIAVIKYWGKRDSNINLPINSSVSVTLNMEHLSTTTTVLASTAIQQDELWLNGVQENPTESKRVQNVLRELRARAGDRVVDGKVVVAKEDWPKYKFRIVSKNSFPTAAGLASSASGYACMVKVLSTLLNVKEQYPGELSTIARMGSGSACRSLYGGFVKWEMGQATDGKDSCAVQVVDEKHWPELQTIICVVSDHKKDTSSTSGMSDSVRTSELLAHRASSVVPKRMDSMLDAYRNKDFAQFAEIAMKDSNQFHATCLDTYPPIFYMNDVSREIIRMVHRLNKEAGRTCFGYTFDAGPNAVLFALQDDVQTLMDAVLKSFPPSADKQDDFAYVRGKTPKTAKQVLETVSGQESAQHQGVLQYIFHTDIGPGATVRDSATEALVDLNTGLPL